MSENVVSVTANSTMSEAADVLSERHLSGAPVVNEMGHCVGVLSGTDYIHDKASELYEGPHARHVLVQQKPGDVFEVEEIMHDLVRRHMTTAVQTVDQDRSLLGAARCMCNEHIHRLIVLDENETPVGVLSSLDVVAAMVGAFDEQRQGV
jgi:CBS domain-containing protein